MLRLKFIHQNIDADEKDLPNVVSNLLEIDVSEIVMWEISRKHLEKGDVTNLYFSYNVDFKVNDEQSVFEKNCDNINLEKVEPYQYVIPENKRKSSFRPIIVGAGPAGLFAALTLARAGLSPLIIERGECVENRKKDVEKFWKTGKLNTESNVQFGEGGAGTFSDGKLNTGVKKTPCYQVLLDFVEAGAPSDILYSTTPHIGTDKLVEVVRTLREKIISLGGEFWFNCKLDNIITSNNAVFGVYITNSSGEQIPLQTDALILAIGHSARDTYEMLYDKGVLMIQKPFSLGVRIEHPQKMINKSQHGTFAENTNLGSASYKLACHTKHERGAYTFCMCPGGYVVASSSEKGGIVTNGMSNHARENRNANTAILLGVSPEIIGSSHPLAGIEFQRKIEKTAFSVGGENYNAPAQLVGDFLARQSSRDIGEVLPTYQPGVTLTQLEYVLPEQITEKLRYSLIQMNSLLDGYTRYDAVLTAPETRSSATLRIIRNEFYQANIQGIYPCGEGAGYAGGIVSSAADGIRCAHAVLSDEFF